ncbi:alpha/beta hydrolase [Ascidiimonas sp. W6]|uniref:alpha/beta hydrolase n=1 Tax=Ascidiimonas meishanensis TaxID=3128903 RepID=UPI0030ED1B1D
MKLILPLVLIFTIITMNAQQLPKVAFGVIQKFDSLPSKYVAARNVDVWLPENYTVEKKYDVLYMQDGQMLFDSTTTWNKQEWGVDETVNQLISEKKIRECIVVGIWNGQKLRHFEYFPQKAFEAIPQHKRDSIYNDILKNDRGYKGVKMQSDNYLRFLVEELKPLIDERYATRPEKEHTFIAGSSMGALISMYAICEYPEVFGGAACISTHWPGLFTLENNPVPEAFMTYLSEALPDPKTHKFYFDHGTETLDALYPSIQKQADSILKSKGFTRKNWITKVFKGDDHSENSWKQRLHIPLEFLLKKK